MHSQKQPLKTTEIVLSDETIDAQAYIAKYLRFTQSTKVDYQTARVPKDEGSESQKPETQGFNELMEIQELSILKEKFAVSIELLEPHSRFKRRG